MLVLAAALALAILVWAVVAYNRFVSLGRRADGAWSDIDVQLKRRHDLVGNLVEAVKGYAHHEHSVLERVASARSLAEDARSSGRPAAAGTAETGLSSAMGRLIAIAEAYPDLKASERFADLQRALTDVEDDLQNARRYYNAVVRDFNTRVESLPDLFVARTFAIREREFFALDDRREAEAPRVEMAT